MAGILKLSVGLLATAGFVVCSLPNAAILQQSTLVSDSSEQAALRNARFSSASATEPRRFLNQSSRLVQEYSVPQRLSAQQKRVDFSFWAASARIASSGDVAPLTGSNAIRFEQIMRDARTRSLYQRPMGEIVQAIADRLSGSTYQPNLLDHSAEETLVISLTQFDCVLFVETVLAMARGVALQDYSYQSFVHQLQNQRYRDGKLNGYCSRLHYFSEWITDNQKRGNVSDIARAIGGISFSKLLNFMSSHRHSYPRLVNDEDAYRCVRQMEANLNPTTISYIPHSQIRYHYAQLKPGDIVAIATDIPGLDVTHTGLVYRNADGSKGLIHATPGDGVRVSPDLQTYINRVDHRLGILVARPVDPRVSFSGP
ncbi:DUF1460 domain-containing protein [Leptothermofonsia sichuanensis E412]|uniref:N-acetylmuramoyl-L-alanine amidase-like domain-containing protein n=1 Tax=Leptothermofonsia sichuanensis TaxID=2917832 RepID=UPI001CA749B3|nr:N-acetylmuramoyl-L-alanine amidase-like domain-containing protein [Leptothermofonsia sichuanensis]QZZ20481.1 DUF1460 domain-containing protein [Leptothermofonsia sichuanensis E412]